MFALIQSQISVCSRTNALRCHIGSSVVCCDRASFHYWTPQFRRSKNGAGRKAPPPNKRLEAARRAAEEKQDEQLKLLKRDRFLVQKQSDEDDHKSAITVPRAPTIEEAKQLSAAYRCMDNVSLVTLGGLGEHQARKEILVRHIMAVDEVPYHEALETCHEIEEANHHGMYLLGLPFQIGAASMAIFGVVSIPMVFDLNTVEWFNELYVTADEPPPKDLETWLEVGAWSWNWMEPLLGTSTFILMCMQYFRINMDHLGIKPYTHRLKNIRAQRLADQFPRYDREVLMKYSETATIYK